MIPDNLLFIQVVPKDYFFHWQVEVQITNFRKHNVSDRMHILVWYPEVLKNELEQWKELQKKYPEVHFYFYRDEGVQLRLYIPQLRPHTLKKFFKEHQEYLKDKIFFYHDADIIFNYLPDFEELAKGNICWQSNCTGYLDYSYLRKKEEQGNIPKHEAIQRLANIGGVTVEDIIRYDGKTGGAQYILKGIDYTFWEDVERMVIQIRLQFAHWDEVPNNYTSVNSKYFPPDKDENGKVIKRGEHKGFQSWCADMWAVNFSLWKRGIETKVTTLLDFSWATDTAEKYYEKPIMHNAGVTKGTPGVFYKGDWRHENPFKAAHAVKSDSASYFYLKAMMEVN